MLKKNKKNINTLLTFVEIYNKMIDMRKTKKTTTKSRRQLIDAYLGLLAKNEKLEKKDIRITNISEEAKVNRGTFYSHYSSIEDLDKDASNLFAKELCAPIFKVPMREIFTSPLRYIQLISRQIENNFDLVCKLEKTKYADEFIHQNICSFIDTAMKDDTIKDIRASVGSDDLFAFIVFGVLNGIIGVARECIRGNINVPIGSFTSYITDSIQSLLNYIKYIMEFKEVLPTSEHTSDFDEADKF